MVREASAVTQPQNTRPRYPANPWFHCIVLLIREGGFRRQLVSEPGPAMNCRSQPCKTFDLRLADVSSLAL